MPRTKVSKSTKRNREVDNREEKLREFDFALDSFVNSLDTICNQNITEVDQQVEMMLQRTNHVLLHMKMSDFLELNLEKLSDWRQPEIVIEAVKNSSSYSVGTKSFCNSTASVSRGNKISNPYDEGYLTEDSTNGAAAASLLRPMPSATNLRKQQQGRPTGPLNSARARNTRRSRSACDTALKSKPSTNMQYITPMLSTSKSSTIEHSSRSKMRTPMTAQRTKAYSADRSTKDDVAKSDNGTTYQSPPNAFIRWPKPGELVVSSSGSPVVSQLIPANFANVNIPVRNGVLSLRPKKLCEQDANFIDGLEPETLSQLKMLHANLNLIMNMADKAASK